jgi:hypothetical protein
LIDGRSVCTPLYSGRPNRGDQRCGCHPLGCQCDERRHQHHTRGSYLTQGSFIDAAGGDQEQLGGARYGARINLSARIRIPALSSS